MAPRFPYTRYVCPCTDINAPPAGLDGPIASQAAEEEQDTEEQTFDPSSPRAAFALYPLENLLFCNECHELRCPRCYYEEALQYYCPSCLWETQPSVVKSETNRCTRSCFQCPVCSTSLATSTYPTAKEEASLGKDVGSINELPCILSCPSCSWSSLEADLVFPQVSKNFYGQLAKLRSGASLSDIPSETSGTPKDLRSASEASYFETPNRVSRPEDQFTQLATFYRRQISETSHSGPLGLGHNFGLDSPSQLSRILSMYGAGGIKKQKDHVPLMREVLDQSEGLRLGWPEEAEGDNDDDVIAQMQCLGWEGTIAMQQQSKQVNGTRFFKDLWPVATQLRSRRAKRCRTCRHNLVKHDKGQRWRHQIKLVAINFIPKINVRPLDQSIDLASLKALKTVQLLLTFQNPIFDTVKVTLATSPTAPGKVSSKVTILCPQFEIGANTDVWDEALGNANSQDRSTKDAPEGAQAEAGKVWEKGKNWTSVIMEIVPGTPFRDADAAKLMDPAGSVSMSETQLRSTVEVPLFIRLEYETDDAPGEILTEVRASKPGNEKKSKRELAYWSVLGVGEIAMPAD